MKITKSKHIWQLKFQGEWPTSVTFLGNDQIAAGNRAGQIITWTLPQDAPEPATKKKAQDPPDHAPQRLLEGHTNGISRLVATRDGKTLVSASLDRTIRLWNPKAESKRKSRLVLDAKDRQRKARYKAKKDKAGILEAPGVEVEIADAESVLSGHQDWIGSLGLSRDEKRLVSGDMTSLVISWDLAGRKKICEWKGHPWNWIVAAALSPDGRMAFVSEYASKRDDFDIPAAALKLWDTANGKEKVDLLKLQCPKLDVKSATYGSARVWRKFVGRGLIAADFSPDGKLIAAGQGGETDNGTVHLFDAANGKLLRSVAKHRYGVCDVRFSADGKYVVSSGRDTMVRICQVEDGKEVAALGKSRGGQFKDWIHALAISPDQRLVAGADIAGYVHVWRLA